VRTFNTKYLGFFPGSGLIIFRDKWSLDSDKQVFYLEFPNRILHSLENHKLAKGLVYNFEELFVSGAPYEEYVTS
jgi:hypothetical protein